LSVRNSASGVNLDFTSTDPIVLAGGTITGIEMLGRLDGSDFADTIIAGPATSQGYANYIFGSVYGYGGDDKLVAGFYTPSLYGGDGNDTLTAAPNGTVSMLIGGAGADKLFGGASGDFLSSADGTVDPRVFYLAGYPTQLPVFDHGLEIDTISGGSGNDTVMIGWGDSANGGADTDTLVVSFAGASAGVSVAFDQNTQALVLGGGTISGFENVDWVEGSNFGDTISFGTTGFGVGAWGGQENVLAGGGDDTVTAGYYTVLIDGGDGNDTLDGAGSQYLGVIYGGAGDDIIHGSSVTTGAYLFGGGRQR